MEACLGRDLTELGPLFGIVWTSLVVFWTPLARFSWAFVFPLRRGGTCPARTWNCTFCATSAPLVDPVLPVASRFGTGTNLDLGRSLVPLTWVLESSNGSFRHGFWLCRVRVAIRSK